MFIVNKLNSLTVLLDSSILESTVCQKEPFYCGISKPTEFGIGVSSTGCVCKPNIYTR